MKFIISPEVYQKNVCDLDLSQRALNILKRNKMDTIEDVLDRQSELYSLKGCGVTSVKEIKNKILEMQIEETCSAL